MNNLYLNTSILLFFILFFGLPELLSKIIFSVFGGVLLFCMVPMELLRSKLKKRHRKLTEPLGLYDSEHNLSPYQQNQQQQRSGSSHVFMNSEPTNLRFFSTKLSLLGFLQGSNFLLLCSW